MLHHLFKSIIRSFRKERFYALLNIGSLSLGMFCFLVVALFVRDEMTHDKWHDKVDNIYAAKIKWGGSSDMSFFLYPPIPYAEGIKESSSVVVDAVNLSFELPIDVKLGEEWIKEEVYYSTSSLFNVFDFSLKYGDSDTALDEPKSIVISEEISRKYFGGEDPVGQMLEIKGSGFSKVTGVLNPIPRNSHLQFDLISPMDFNDPRFSSLKNNWSFGSGGLAYLLLAPEYDLEQLKSDTKELLARNGQVSDMKEFVFGNFGELYLTGTTMRFNDDNLFGGDTKYLYIFSIVGILILFVATFNYVNLTSARLFTKTKAVMIRKIVGASRLHLIIRFVTESLTYSILALVLALITMEITLPYINTTIGKELGIDYFTDLSVLWIPFLLTLLVGLLSGIYPAIVASKLNLANSLKGDSPITKSYGLRKALIVLQFMICGGLVIATLVIRGQAKYLIDFDLGYNSENVVNLNLSMNGFRGKYLELKSELERIPIIEDISGSPLPTSNSVVNMEVEKDGEKQMITPTYLQVDKGFRSYFGVELIAGQGLEDLTDDELRNSVLVNETVVKELGLIDPIGFELAPKYKIVGVVKDFHFSSAKSKVGPLLMQYSPEKVTNIHIRFRPENKDAVLAQIESVCSSFGTGRAFTFSLMEGYFDDSYRKEAGLVKVFDILTALLMIVAFLGLFALANFEARQREKEIGIRKVLGANYVHLIKTLGQKFIWLVIIALLLAIPISNYLLSNWLQSFPYHLDIGVKYFAVTTLGTIVLTISILGFHGYSNALKNPVKILRNE